MADGEVMAPGVVRQALEEIAIALAVIDDECQNYGGWAGRDEDAKVAANLGHQLASLGMTVALFGREAAERG